MPGTITISTLSDGTNSTSATNPILGSAKAWVNFNGTGTPAIRASYNVSSITANGTGDYTINFTNALSSANYVLAGTALETSSGGAPRFMGQVSATTSACNIKTAFGNLQYQDCQFVQAAILSN
jgi:hypothetical protein